jgi:1,2-dihydroxy-3-keto-5-methylthiopentene dioxygenase
MAIVRVPSQDRKYTDPDEFRDVIGAAGITYEKWEPSHPIGPNSSAQEILEAYSPEINRLKEEGGYVTADVIDVKPDTPNLDVMLAKFSREHWHDEDEVRFIIEGRGIFHIHPRNGAPVMAIEVYPGDLLRVPRGTWHWFDLCSDKRIRAIRLFQDASGWTPHYTDSGVDKDYQPICFGPSYVPAIAVAPSVG